MGKMEKMEKMGKKKEKMGKKGKMGKWRKWSNVKCSLSAAGAKAAVRSNFGCQLSLVGKYHSINFIGGLFPHFFFLHPSLTNEDTWEVLVKF